MEELSTEIRDLEDANETLKEEKDNMDSPEFKEKMARERLGMIGEDEYSLQQSEDAGEKRPGRPEMATAPKIASALGVTKKRIPPGWMAPKSRRSAARDHSGVRSVAAEIIKKPVDRSVFSWYDIAR